MNALTTDKMKHLLQYFLDDADAQRILSALNDDTVDLVTFRQLVIGGVEQDDTPASAPQSDCPVPMLYTPDRFTALLREKFRGGVTAHIDGIGADSLYNYINTGYLSGGGPLRAQLDTPLERSTRLDVQLWLQHADYPYVTPDDRVYRDTQIDRYIERNFPQSDDYGSTPCSLLTAFVSRHPQLSSGQLCFHEDWSNFHDRLLVEGRPFYVAIALMFHCPDITTGQLKSLLRGPDDNLQRMVDLAGGTPGTFNLYTGSGLLYFIEPGVLGYMTADRERTLRAYGTFFTPSLRWQIKELVATRQFVCQSSGSDTLFFSDLSGGAGVRRVYLDRKTCKAILYTPYLLWDDRVVLADFHTVLSSERLQRLVDVTDRITDIDLDCTQSTTALVTCRVDGQQMTVVSLTPKDTRRVTQQVDDTGRYLFLKKYLAGVYSGILLSHD